MAAEAQGEAAVSVAAGEPGQEAAEVRRGAVVEHKVVAASGLGCGVSLCQCHFPTCRRPRGGALLRTEGATIATQ